MYTYNATNKEVYPAHYLYANSPTGYDWDIDDQDESNPAAANGYIHWSGSLFDTGNSAAVSTDAFTCPSIATKGGAPRQPVGANADRLGVRPDQRRRRHGDAVTDIPTDRQARAWPSPATGRSSPATSSART